MDDTIYEELNRVEELLKKRELLRGFLELKTRESESCRTFRSDYSILEIVKQVNDYLQA